MKVVIVGKGKGCADAPLEGETWGICQCLRRRIFKRIIDMNDYSLWGATEAKADKLSRQAAAKNGIPYVDLTNYPIKEVVSYFGVDYFTNTVDYALALAIYEGFTEIDLYGVNMAWESEYEFEKPGVEFWTGQAMGRGIKVTVFGRESTILKTRDGLLYGYGKPQGYFFNH
jgi:hypothetical protein